MQKAEKRPFVLLDAIDRRIAARAATRYAETMRLSKSPDEKDALFQILKRYQRKTKFLQCAIAGISYSAVLFCLAPMLTDAYSIKNLSILSLIVALTYMFEIVRCQKFLKSMEENCLQSWLENEAPPASIRPAVRRQRIAAAIASIAITMIFGLSILTSSWFKTDTAATQAATNLMMMGPLVLLAVSQISGVWQGCLICPLWYKKQTDSKAQQKDFSL